MKALRWIGLALAVVALLAALFTIWLVNSPSGARFALKRIEPRIPGKLTVGRVEGSLAGPLVLRELEYRAPNGQPPVVIGRIELDVAARELLHRRLQVVRASVSAVRVELPAEAARKPGLPRIPVPPATLPRLQPRWPIHIDEFVASSVVVTRAGEHLLAIDEARAAGRWTDQEIAVERFEVSGPDGAGDLSGRLAMAGTPRLEGVGRLRWAIRGVTYAGEVNARTEAGRPILAATLAAPFAARMQAELRPSPMPPSWTVMIDIPEFDPRGALLPPTSRVARLGLELRGEGSGDDARFHGTTVIDGERLVLEEFDAGFAGDALRVRSLVVRVDDGSGSLHARGEVRVAAGGPEFDLVVQPREFALPEAWVTQPFLADGEFRLSGAGNGYAAEGAMAIGPAGRPSQVEFSLRGDRQGLQLEPLRVVQPDGNLEARGEVRFAPVRWDASASAREFNPGEFLPNWSGRLRGEIESRGEQGADGLRVAVSMKAVSGQLRDRPISGMGNLTFSSVDGLQGELDFASGGTRVRIRRADSETEEAQVDLVLPALQEWIPGAAGELRVAAVLRGRWPAVGVSGNATGRGLEYGAFKIGRLELTADVPEIRRIAGRVRGELEEASAGTFAIAKLRLDGKGDESAHELSLVAEGRPVSANLRLAGRMDGEKWLGTLQELQFGWSDLPRLTLESPANLSIARDGAVELSRASFAGGDIRLALAGARTTDGELSGELGLERLPLSLFDALAPGAMPVRVEGAMNAQARFRRGVEGTWSGEGSLSSPQARIIQSDRPTAPRLDGLLLYEGLTIEASTDGRTGRASVQAGLAAQGRVAVEAAFTGLERRDPQLEADIKANMPTLEPFAALLPQVPGLEGKIEATLKVTGRVTAPAVSGQVEASALKAELPRLGLRLRDGNLKVEPGAGSELRLSGGVTSGGGRARLQGTWIPGGGGRATLKAERFLAADLPSARVVVTPDLSLTYEATGLMVRGRAEIVEAAVNLQQLPQGRPQARSRDVVVVDRPQEERRQRLAPLSAEVAVELKENVRVTGFGLEAQLRGGITVFEKPGTPTTAAGEVLAEGTYEGYGQDLKITRGRVLFAGTPIDDPRLDITAERELEDITAGLHITGTARAPEVQVFSRPDMGQADALAYLVTGKPLSGVASQGESDLLDSAAKSLGTAAGSLLAERIGHRLGIDEIGIEDSDMIEGGVFTIGQYLSPRLYVAYGVGLFEPGDLVTLRYELTKALNLRAVRGPDETRAGVEYRIER